MNTAALHDLPLSFNEAQRQQIDNCLLRLADQMGAPLVMLTDISGRLILYRGRLPAEKSTGLAALASAGFAAAQEIAGFLGLKSGFRQQLLEGKLADLYIMGVGPELLLIMVYTRRTTLGMARLFGEQAQTELLQLAQAAAKERDKMAEEAKNRQVEAGFGSELSRQLDELFAGDDTGMV